MHIANATQTDPVSSLISTVFAIVAFFGLAVACMGTYFGITELMAGKILAARDYAFVTILCASTSVLLLHLSGTVRRTRHPLGPLRE